MQSVRSKGLVRSQPGRQTAQRGCSIVTGQKKPSSRHASSGPLLWGAQVEARNHERRIGREVSLRCTERADRGAQCHMGIQDTGSQVGIDDIQQF
jgi:hypothetical protein